MEPLVSICSITYNHEKYISDAIDSFLMQKVDFPIEIIIHDDASTDCTAKIIKKYEEKYPDIIKPIYQKENQYSKGINILENLIYPKAHGKYIALCEGDDYWTDPHKLQKQVNILESYDDYSVCFHAVKIMDPQNKFLGMYKGPYLKGSRTYDISATGLGAVMHLSSILMRAEFFKIVLPDWLIRKDGSMLVDVKLAIYLGIKGKTYYIDEVMSAYRLGVENSIMTKTRKNFSAQDWIEHLKLRNSVMNEIDAYYSYKYHNQFEEIKLKSEFGILMLTNNLPAIKSKSDYKTLDLKTKITIYLRYYMPEAYKIIKSIYHKLPPFMHFLSR